MPYNVGFGRNLMYQVEQINNNLIKTTTKRILKNLQPFSGDVDGYL